MQKKSEEKYLEVVEEKSFWIKIKKFFRKFFMKEKEIVNTDDSAKPENISIDSKKIYMKDENEIHLLQKRFQKGEIEESELTDEQVKALCDLYDKQIMELKRKNEARKIKIMKYRMKKFEM